MLAHLQLAPLGQVDGDDVAGVAAEGDHALAGRLGDEDHAGDHPLQRAGHGLDADANAGMFPQQDVVEIDRQWETSTESTGTSSPSIW